MCEERVAGWWLGGRRRLGVPPAKACDQARKRPSRTCSVWACDQQRDSPQRGPVAEANDVLDHQLRQVHPLPVVPVAPAQGPFWQPPAAANGRGRVLVAARAELLWQHGVQHAAPATRAHPMLDARSRTYASHPNAPMIASRVIAATAIILAPPVGVTAASGRAPRGRGVDVAAAVESAVAAASVGAGTQPPCRLSRALRFRDAPRCVTLLLAVSNAGPKCSGRHALLCARTHRAHGAPIWRLAVV